MKTTMKAKYTEPTTEVVLIEGGHHLLAGSPDGVKATISGYEGDTSGDYGFSQE